MLLDLGHLKIASRRLDFEARDLLEAVKGRVLAVHIHENDGITPL